MMKKVDSFLNNITMYRLVLYYLTGLLIAGIFLSFFSFLPFKPLALILSSLIVIFVCWLSNMFCSRFFNAVVNIESAYISAFILVLVLSPAQSVRDVFFLAVVSFLCMFSKYALAIGKKHIFNPVSIALVVAAFIVGKSASWWIGTMSMLPFVILGGILIVRKIKRFDLVASFLLTALITIISINLARGFGALPSFYKAIIDSPILFFAFVMLTEPLTTPPSRKLRIAYGVLTGILFSPRIHLGPIYSTPELALSAGNIFSYLVSPKDKLALALKEKVKIGDDAYDFVFIPDRKISFTPGQYLEWTLGSAKPDSRGNRRYFTISSSPTEQELRIGVKFHENSSSFKKDMLSMKAGDRIIASQLSGDFIMPKDKREKLAFIAGGIGITPFRSMIKYMIDSKENRQAVLLYSNKHEGDIVYREIFDLAEKECGLRTVYALTDLEKISEEWRGEKGFVDRDMIQKYIPDYRQRTFYISGPNSMVVHFEDMLKGMGVSKNKIITDYFPGFA